jgi:hypothetical protein
VLLRGRDGGTNFILRIKEQETRLILPEHDDDDDDDDDDELDVRGSVHHSTIHKENSNKMHQCIKILSFHIYMKLNMFRATRRPSSGA